MRATRAAAAAVLVVPVAVAALVTFSADDGVELGACGPWVHPRDAVTIQRERAADLLATEGPSVAASVAVGIMTGTRDVALVARTCAHEHHRRAAVSLGAVALGGLGGGLVLVAGRRRDDATPGARPASLTA